MTGFFLRILLVLPSMLLLTSANAGWFGFGGTSWKEEILLHDGQKIIVERTAKRHGRHEIGQRPPIGDQSISFTMPETSQHITWEDNYSDDLGASNFLPMLLDVENGVAYLIASPMGYLSYEKWGRPNPPYVLFKYQDKTWQRIPLQELPSDISTPNLIISEADVEAKKVGTRFISAREIQEINSGFRQPEYRTILREPLPNGTGWPIPTNVRAEPIAPVMNGKILYYNWWPLAIDWLESECPTCDHSAIPSQK